MVKPYLLPFYEKIKESIEPTARWIVGKSAPIANPLITDAVVKSLMENEAAGIPNAIHYANVVEKALKVIGTGVSACLAPGAASIVPEVAGHAIDSVKEIISGGGVDKQLENTINKHNTSGGFAHGGQVESDPESNSAFSRVFPAQNMLLSAAKGRVSGYLMVVFVDLVMV